MLLIPFRLFVVMTCIGIGLGWLCTLSQSQAADQPATSASGVRLPTNAVGSPNSQVVIPVMVQGLTDALVFSYQFTVRFDPLILSGVGVSTTNSLSAGWALAENHQNAGEIQVAAFHTTPLAGEGRLLDLIFIVSGQPATQTALTWHTPLFNESIVQGFDGRFLVTTAITATPIPAPTATLAPRSTTVPAQRGYLPLIHK